MDRLTLLKTSKYITKETDKENESVNDFIQYRMKTNDSTQMTVYEVFDLFDITFNSEQLSIKFFSLHDERHNQIVAPYTPTAINTEGYDLNAKYILKKIHIDIEDVSTYAPSTIEAENDKILSEQPVIYWRRHSEMSEYYRHIISFQDWLNKKVTLIHEYIPTHDISMKVHKDIHISLNNNQIEQMIELSISISLIKKKY